MDLLAIGSALLRDKLQQAASTQITFTRGVNSIQPFATRGTSTWDANTENGVTEIQTSDYILAVNAFDAFGLPQEGDLITDHNQTMELLPAQNGLFYRYCNSARTLIRVHTKQIQ